MSCPVCSSTSVAIYIDGPDDALTPAMVGSSRTVFAPGRILRCRSCGFGFREFRPSDEELASVYEQLETNLYDSETEGRSRTAQRHLEIVNRYATKQGSILDVGCASGLFLKAAQDAGWNVVGVEPSETLAPKAQRLVGESGEIQCSTLQEADLADASFDAMTLWDLLEHVSDPSPFLARCARLLKRDGYLFANVPDLDSVQSRILRSRWPLLLPEHLNYFNVASLRKCGENAGLQWLGFHRRPVAFTLDYVLYRMNQHHIPATSIAQKFVRRIGVENRLAWFHLGEICGVWKRNAVS